MFSFQQFLLLSALLVVCMIIQDATHSDAALLIFSIVTLLVAGANVLKKVPRHKSK